MALRLVQALINWLQAMVGHVSRLFFNTRDETSYSETKPLLQPSPAIVDYSRQWPNDLGFDTVREERNPIALTVTGYIPDYAAGTIYRNGPGARKVPGTNWECSHWFDGFGQLHKFELHAPVAQDGVRDITYTSRFTVDTLLEEIAEKRRYDGFTFAQRPDPCQSLFRKVMALYVRAIPPKSTVQGFNVPVTVTTNRAAFPQDELPTNGPSKILVTTTDEARYQAIDATTLEPVAVASQKAMHPRLTGPLSASHNAVDLETREVFNYNLDFARYPTYRVFKTDGVQTTILASITGPDIAPAYMHSFFMSANYVVLCVWSAHIMAKGLRVLWEGNMLDAIAPFDSQNAVTWWVVDRRHGKGVVATFTSPAAFCFHTINAHEVEGPDGTVDLVCDLIEYDNLDVLKKFYYENLRSSSPHAGEWCRAHGANHGQKFARYRLPGVPLATKSSLQVLTTHQREIASPLPAPKTAAKIVVWRDPSIGDLPVIDTRRATLSYRFVWLCSFDPRRSTFADSLTKLDVTNGKMQRWEEPGHSPGEVIFVPNPAGDAEDDGVLLTIVLDGLRGTSYLLCLDAKTMKELGRASCEGPLAFTFHGEHVKAEN